MELVHKDYSIRYNIGYKDIRVLRPNSYHLAKYIIAFRVFAVFWFVVFLIKLIISCVQVLTAVKE